MTEPRSTEYAPLDRTHRVFSAILPLLAHRSDGTRWASGSAFMIGQGLAITALHVIQDYSERLTATELTKEAVLDDDSPTAYSVVADQVVNGKHVLWKVASMWAADPLDLAILSLVPPRNVDPSALTVQPPVRFAPPSIGDRVLAIGFPAQHVGRLHDTSIEWTQEPYVATGVVDEVHSAYRDTGRLRFPCFRTNARFDGGMSGGPVVTAAGAICGAICSNLPPSTDEEEHVSYASLLWPTLAMSARPNATVAQTEPVVTLRTLYQQGALRSDDWDRVRVDEDGKRVHLLT